MLFWANLTPFSLQEARAGGNKRSLAADSAASSIEDDDRLARLAAWAGHLQLLSVKNSKAGVVGETATQLLPQSDVAGYAVTVCDRSDAEERASERERANERERDAGAQARSGEAQRHKREQARLDAIAAWVIVGTTTRTSPRRGSPTHCGRCGL